MQSVRGYFEKYSVAIILMVDSCGILLCNFSDIGIQSGPNLDPILYINQYGVLWPEWSSMIIK